MELTPEKMAESNQRAAKEFIETFGFKKKLEEIISKEDRSLVPIFSSNIAIFGVAATVVLSSSGQPLSASVLLILISAVLSLFNILLNIWYLIRYQMRKDFLRKQQEIIFNKAELNTIKAFDLFEKIMRSDIIKNATILMHNNINKEDLVHKLKEESSQTLSADDVLFIPSTIMNLALLETRMNVRACLDEPLKERYAGFKLFIDRLSDRFKNLGLVLSSVLILSALLVKYIIG